MVFSTSYCHVLCQCSDSLPKFRLLLLCSRESPPLLIHGGLESSFFNARTHLSMLYVVTSRGTNLPVTLFMPSVLLFFACEQPSEINRTLAQVSESGMPNNEPQTNKRVYI